MQATVKIERIINTGWATYHASAYNVDGSPVNCSGLPVSLNRHSVTRARWEMHRRLRSLGYTIKKVELV